MDKKTFAAVLVGRVRALVLLSLLLFTLSLFLLIVRPATDNAARAQMGLMAQQVDARLQRLLQGVETRLRTGRDFALATRLSPHTLAEFNAFFQAQLAHNAELSAAFLADDTGRELILFREADGSWRNRISDPVNLGATSFWVSWNAQRQPVSAEARTVEGPQAYDARKRPWYQGAMALADERQIYWTAPYAFFTLKEPGVTAALRFTGADGRRYVLGLDVRLLDLSRFTSSLVLGQTGVAAIVNERGELLALPRAEQLKDDAALAAAVLKTPQAAGLPLVAQGVAQWQADGRPGGELDGYWQGVSRWHSLFVPAKLGATPVWLAVFAARSEFIPAGWQELGAMGLIVLLALVGGTMMAVLLAKEFARPLQALTKESERVGRMELERPFNQSLVWSPVAEISTLAQTLDTMRERLLQALPGHRDRGGAADFTHADHSPYDALHDDPNEPRPQRTAV